MEKRIVLILPYFGKFPQWMNLFLKSCANNPSIDFLIFTDDQTAWDYPANVKVVRSTLGECVNRIENKLQTKFDFEFKPYKLVDFKVAYGVIFEDYIKDGGYDFWGFCDCDVIWGDIRKYITDSILENYDKIGIHGHLEIFRNEYTFNRLFLLGTEKIPFETLLRDNSISWYDEYNGIATIYHKLGIQQYSIRNRIADIYPDHTDGFFVDVNLQNYKKQIYYYDDGKLYQLKLDKFNKCVERKELMYMHFQKVKLPVLCGDDCNCFYICKEGFLDSIDYANSDSLDSGCYRSSIRKMIPTKLKYCVWERERALKAFVAKRIKGRIF